MTRDEYIESLIVAAPPLRPEARHRIETLLGSVMPAGDFCGAVKPRRRTAGGRRLVVDASQAA